MVASGAGGGADAVGVEGGRVLENLAGLSGGFFIEMSVMFCWSVVLVGFEKPARLEFIWLPEIGGVVMMEE